MLKRLSIACLLCLLPLLALAQEARLLPPTAEEIQGTQKQGRYLATLTMEEGKTIEIVLEGAYMPMMVANFVKLVKAKYYDGMDLGAVTRKLATGREASFVTGGDLSGAGPGYRLPLEISPYLSVVSQGAVSMVPLDTQEVSGSQLIFARSALPGLFCTFGWVKSGMDVVNALQSGTVIKSVTVAPYKGTEACPILTPMPEAAAFRPPMKTDIDAVEKQGRYLATINMESGKKIVLVLEGKQAPVTVANFVKLAKAKYYDGLVFHRVEAKEGFGLIQGGDPAGTGGGGPGYEIRYEASDLLNKTGAIGMARSQGLNTAGSQFYILRNDVPNLDKGLYAVFGWVKEGLDVVNTVKIGDRMKSVTVVPYTGTEPCPVLAPPKPAQ
ncbi:MAG: peptidylprolyl isomerase [Armatimonadota bacterium]